ncbi:hypothetical protein BC628DRAFT_1393081, partial [Trametes gibbosa]
MSASPCNAAPCNNQGLTPNPGDTASSLAPAGCSSRPRFLSNSIQHFAPPSGTTATMFGSSHEDSNHSIMESMKYTQHITYH